MDTFQLDPVDLTRGRVATWSRCWSGELRHVGAARTWAARVAAHLTPSLDGDTVRLLTSELVTNAIVHVRGPIRVCVFVEVFGLTIAVVDAGAATGPVRGDDGGRAESGRGLDIVEDLSTRWGTVSVEGGGRMVWCTLAWDR